MEKLDLRDLDLAEMEKLIKELGAAPYRARQLFAWVHGRGTGNFEEMTDLPRSLRQALAGQSHISQPVPGRRVVSADGLTRKYLLSLPDGQAVETVLMLYRRRTARNRVTACISSQVGCGLACRFCATGEVGFLRNLRPGELVGQVYFWNRELGSGGQKGRVTNVVYMGMGEPLLNYEAVLKSIRLLTHPLGLNIGHRRITLSTCGVVPGIYRLAGEGLPVRLAVSLHAADDDLRSRLLPINRRYPLAELLPACRYYAERTGRRVTFAYLLLAGVNDEPADARRLARLLREIPCKVNLIPFNAVAGKEFRRPAPQRVRSFATALASLGLEVSVREERGADIAAACGQLRGQVVEAE